MANIATYPAWRSRNGSNNVIQSSPCRSTGHVSGERGHAEKRLELGESLAKHLPGFEEDDALQEAEESIHVFELGPEVVQLTINVTSDGNQVRKGKMMADGFWFSWNKSRVVLVNFFFFFIFYFFKS